MSGADAGLGVAIGAVLMAWSLIWTQLHSDMYRAELDRITGKHAVIEGGKVVYKERRAGKP